MELALNSTPWGLLMVVEKMKSKERYWWIGIVVTLVLAGVGFGARFIADRQAFIVNQALMAKNIEDINRTLERVTDVIEEQQDLRDAIGLLKSQDAVMAEQIRYLERQHQ